MDTQLSRPRRSPERPRADEAPAGEREWRAFYEAHSGFVYRVVSRLAGPELAVEDICQDVFLALIRGLPGFEGRAALQTWMYRVCLNVVSEHRRRAWRARRLRGALSWLGAAEARAPSPEGQVQSRLELDALRAVLGELSRKRREVFVLCELEQLGPAEAAEVLGVPAVTVRTRLFHARKDCARRLAAREAER